MPDTNPPPLPSRRKPKKTNGCLPVLLIVAGLTVLLIIIIVLKVFSGGRPINAQAFIDAEATGYIHLTDTTHDAGFAKMVQHITTTFQREQLKHNSQELPTAIIWMQKLQHLQQRSRLTYLKAPQVLAVRLPTQPGLTKTRSFVIVDLNTMPKIMSGVVSMFGNKIFKSASQQVGNQSHRGVPIISDSNDLFIAFHKKVFLTATELNRLKMNIDTLLDKPAKLNQAPLLKDEIPGKWDIKGATCDINLTKGLLETNTFSTSIAAFNTDKVLNDLQRIQFAMDIKSADEIGLIMRIHCNTPDAASQCRAIIKETFVPELQALCENEMLTLTTSLPEAPSKNCDLHVSLSNVKAWTELYIAKFNQPPARREYKSAGRPLPTRTSDIKR